MPDWKRIFDFKLQPVFVMIALAIVMITFVMIVYK